MAVYDTFEATDARKTMLISQYTVTDWNVYNRSNPGKLMDLGPIPLKINPDDQSTTSLSAVDLILYRYACVLLSKAEAIVNIRP